VKLRQCAVALYFIDSFAFRAGKEKGETAGACNLRLEHLKLKKDTGQLFEIYRAFGVSKHNLSISKAVFLKPGEYSSTCRKKI